MAMRWKELFGMQLGELVLSAQVGCDAPHTIIPSMAGES